MATVLQVQQSLKGDRPGTSSYNQKLRAIDPDIKAIVSSGYSNAPVMSEYMNYGFCGVVAKPYELKELGNILYRVIHRKEESRENTKI